MEQAKEMTYLQVMKVFESRVGGTLEETKKGSHYTKDIESIYKPDPEVFLQTGQALGMEKQGEDLWPLRNFGEEEEYFLQYRDADGYLVGVVLTINYKKSVAGIGTISLGAAE